MTEPTEAPAVEDNLEAEAPADTSEIATAETVSAEPDPADGPLAKQAAKYRKRARELETENTSLGEQVTALQHRLAEAHLARERLDPNTFWKLTELSAVLDDDGQVDPAKVAAAAQSVRTSLGIGLHVPAERRATPPPAPSGRQQWDQAFQPR